MKQQSRKQTFSKSLKHSDYKLDSSTSVQRSWAATDSSTSWRPQPQQRSKQTGALRCAQIFTEWREKEKNGLDGSRNDKFRIEGRGKVTPKQQTKAVKENQMAKATGLVLSDLHAGSAFGLLPPDFISAENNHIMPNSGQEYLYKHFDGLLKRLAPRQIDFIVVNGDIMDGEQRKTNGDTLALHRLCDQREAAYKLLRPWQQAFPKADWHFVTGTRYHEVMPEVEQLTVMLFGEKKTV